jgi:hypothetical protein
MPDHRAVHLIATGDGDYVAREMVSLNPHLAAFAKDA